MTISATNERRASAPTIARAATLNPASWNAEARTIEVVWTTGARGARFDWESGESINEELATAPGNVRLGRLNSGAPVLDTHNRNSLGGQIGVVVPGSARMTGGQGVATLRLSDRPELAPIVADIAAGIIRNLSVGYTVHLWEVERQQGAPPTWRAIDWEPTEISFVPVAFDAGAQVRTASDCHPSTIRTLVTEDHAMTDTITPVPTPAPAFAGQTATTAPFATGERAATIGELRGYFDLVRETGHIDHTDAANLVLTSAERGMSMAQVRAATMQLAADRQREATNRHVFASAVGHGETFDNPAVRSRAIEDALYARMSGRAPSEAAREFMGLSMVQIAGAMIEGQGARNVRAMSPNDVLQAAAWNRVGSRAAFMHDRAAASGPFHTTSDFPDLLISAGNRFLNDVYQVAASPLKTMGRRRSASDFRALTGIQVSGFGVLPKVLEGGEVKRGTFHSRKETYSVETFAEIFALSRQMIINDDLGAFSQPVLLLARAAAETEASLLAQLIEGNPVMGDGRRLFSAEHGNLASAGSAPNPESLSAARLAMRGQKDLDGVTPLATAPKYIVGGPAAETEIEAIATSAQLVDVNPEGVKVLIPNPFAGKLTPLIEPRFKGKSWQLFADPALSPVLEYAYLNDAEAPRIETRDGWDTLGTEFRVYMDFGAGVVDYRGAYKNPGAAG